MTTRVYFTRDGKQMASGERPRQAHAPLELADVPAADRPKRPRRPCSACGVPFKPNERRRMLCGNCFARAACSPFEPNGEADANLL